MALSRNRVATARRIQSRRRVRFCLSDNEPRESEKVYRQEILLESENLTYNQDEEKKKTAKG